jgi:hypothetical protein
MKSRLWPRLTLAVAAAASVATSQLPEGWNATAVTTLEPTTIEQGHRQAVYAIHTEVSGPGPYTDLGGYVTVYLHVRASGVFGPEPTLRVTLRSLTNPDVASVEQRVLPNTSSEAWGDLEVFGHCATPPCTEDLELVIDTVNAEGVTVEVDGTFQVSATGENYDLERTTSVTLTASPPL